jgi:rod shape-determining protein MreD
MLNEAVGVKLKNFGPIILLYYFSISELDTHFENYFEILSFNLQLIIVYFWVLKRPAMLGNGHIFLAGLINDVVMGFPLGLSSLSYLVVSFFATYIKNMSVHTTLTSDWFTFIIALLISNFTFLTLISKFTELTFSITEMLYNTFFTFILFPFFWFLFTFYNSTVRFRENA